MKRTSKNTQTAVLLPSGHLETLPRQYCVSRRIAMFASRTISIPKETGQQFSGHIFSLTQIQIHRDKSSAEHSDKLDPLSSNQHLGASHESVGQVALGTDPDSIMGWINTIKEFILLL